jgi:hypothetical protein
MLMQYMVLALFPKSNFLLYRLPINIYLLPKIIFLTLKLDCYMYIHLLCWEHDLTETSKHYALFLYTPGADPRPLISKIFEIDCDIFLGKHLWNWPWILIWSAPGRPCTFPRPWIRLYAVASEKNQTLETGRNCTRMWMWGRAGRSGIRLWIWPVCECGGREQT